MSDFLTQAESLFHQVRALDRSAQAHRLIEIGSQDPDLRTTVEALLQADGTPDERLDRPIRDVVFGEIRASGRVLQSETEALVRHIETPMRPSRRYHDRREIGRGGMGTVYRVRDATLDRDLAMKVVGGAGAGPTQPDQVLRFLREARVLARLDHPGIVPIHDLGVDEDGLPFFTMKLVQGGSVSGDKLGERRTLEDVLRLTESGSPDWSVTRVLEILLRVCESIAYAHSRGVRHRDLKPSNVMVGQFGEVFVMDWGLASIQDDPVAAKPRVASCTAQALEPPSFGDDARELTATGDLLGTPEYMAPEQVTGAPSNQRADIYSIGAILYRVLTGVPPYQDGTAPRKRRAGHQVLARLSVGPPRPVLELAPTSSAELLAICERAMARRFELRYSDVDALAHDLRAYLEQRVVAAYETGAWAETKKWVKRNKLAAASLGLAIIVMGGATALALHMSAVNAREAKSADLHASMTRDTLEFLIAEAQTTLSRVPGAEARSARQALLRTALRRLDQLDELGGGPTRDSVDAINAAIQLADLAEQVGEMGAARRLYSSCLEQLDINAEKIGREKALDLRAQVDWLQARGLVRTGEPANAMMMLESSIAMLRRAVAAQPNNLALRTRLFNALQLWGPLAVENGRQAEGSAALRESDAYRGQDPIAPTHNAEHGAMNDPHTLVTAAVRLRYEGAYEAAVENADEAIRLLNDRPATPGSRQDLIFALREAARNRSQIDDRVGAIVNHQRAISICRAAIDGMPGDHGWLDLLALELSSAAELMYADGNFGDVHAMVCEAKQIQDEFLARDPGAVLSLRNDMQVTQLRARIRCALGYYGSALDDCESAIDQRDCLRDLDQDVTPYTASIIQLLEDTALTLRENRIEYALDRVQRLRVRVRAGP